jgi:hypothetical protein
MLSPANSIFRRPRFAYGRSITTSVDFHLNALIFRRSPTSCFVGRLSFSSRPFILRGNTKLMLRESIAIIKLYNDLLATERMLTPEQFSLLEKANKIYVDKGFEYINVGHAARGFSDFPDLNALDALAAEILKFDKRSKIWRTFRLVSGRLRRAFCGAIAA